MAIKIITDPVVWEKFVDQNNCSTLCHKWDFLKIVSKYTKFDLLTYGIYKKQELIAILPLFLKKMYGLKLLFSPPPMSGVPYLGYIVKDEYFDMKQYQKERYMEIISEGIEEEMKKINPDYISIITIPNLIDTREFIWKNYNVYIKYTYILDLSKDLNDILNGFRRESNKKINEVIKLGVKVNSSDSADTLFEALKHRYHEQGLNLSIVNKEYLNELKKTFPDNILFNQVSFEEGIVGLEALMIFHDTVMTWLGAVKPDKRYPVNEFLHWYDISNFHSRAKRLDLIGADKRNIARFKAQFNPELDTYFIINKMNFKGKFMEYLYFRLKKRAKSILI